MYQLQNQISGIIFNKVFNTAYILFIRDWIENNIDEFSDLLNEPYNCSVELTDDLKSIVICGDEDLLSFDIIEVNIVHL